MTGKTKAIVERTPDRMFSKADQLSLKLFKVPDADLSGEIYGTLIMDPFTLDNFKASRGFQYEFTFSDTGSGYDRWRKFHLKPKFYEPRRALVDFAAAVTDAPVSLNEDPFLMSIVYQTENGRVGYLDDADTDDVFLTSTDFQNKRLRAIVEKRTHRAERAVVKKIAKVATAVGFQAGEPAMELAGQIVSVLAANPEHIGRFMAEGSELFLDGTFNPENGSLAYRSIGGDILHPSVLRQQKGTQQ
ncbi:hypothetical protein PBC5_gp58 [Sinorhizobium phage PBC5]|uniref:hypothetical protein n=1 Tax=Sinorhizobium phage PBC5 TaxID=179237 RepID=UPI001BE526E2|nr:hypothetical protein PBC5_gp58 [Sinorhizobium phage PBC5]